MLTLAGDLYKPLCLPYIIHNMKVIDDTNTDKVSSSYSLANSGSKL